MKIIDQLKRPIGEEMELFEGRFSSNVLQGCFIE